MNQDDCLNILEQRPGWARLATNIAWCFDRPENERTSKLIDTLQNGLEKLVENFPWIAGKVVNEGSDPAKNDTGTYKIVPRHEKPQIILKDHRNTPSVPDIHKLKRSGFAMHLLEENIFAPRSSLILEPQIDNAVLLVQANLVADGLVLVFSGNHSAMDMPGQTQIIRWFSQACRGENFDEQQLNIGNMPRRDLLPLLNATYQPGDELSHQTPLVPSLATSATQAQDAANKIRWATFSFPSASIAALKANATSTRTSEYISKDDALSAFLWQSIARARLHRVSPDNLSTALRAVDVRRTLDIPPEYPGLAQNTLYHKYSLGELAELPLGVVASALRDKLTSTSPSVSYYTRSVITTLSRTADKNCLKVLAKVDRPRDVVLSSYAALPVYDLDFSLGLGVAEAVRLTRLLLMESLTVTLPTMPSGDIVVTTCLHEEDLAHLKADNQMSKYAQYVG